MKCLTVVEANEILRSIGMEIGNWNQITDIANCEHRKSIWKNYQAPKNSHELFYFAEHVAGWLPRGSWKIFQLDNSTSLDAVQAYLFNKLLSGSTYDSDLEKNKTFLFEFGPDGKSNTEAELLIFNLIYLMLLFEGHVQVVSSNSSAGQRLSIQDGFVYFSSRESDISGAETLLRNFECNPLGIPQWISEINADSQ